MSRKPSLEDRMLRAAVPRTVAGYAPPPQEIAPGIWSLERRLRHFGMALLPTRTTLVRLEGGGIVVISPPPLADADTRGAIAALGEVQQVVVPNSFHYLYAREFMEHYSNVSLWGPPGLRERVPELAIDAELSGRAPAAWDGALEIEVLGPVRGASELLFFHPPSASLILTDTAFHMRHYPRALDRAIWRLSGIPAGFGPGRTSRSMLLRDHEVAGRALSRALEWPFERIIVAHGDPVERDAREAFRGAFREYLD